MRAEVAGLKGVTRVEYRADGDVFTVEFNPGEADLDDIFTAVFAAGKKMGREYSPRLLEQ